MCVFVGRVSKQTLAKERMGEMSEKIQIEEMMKKARIAQQAFEPFDQAGVDAIVRAVAKIVYDHAEELAYDAATETGMEIGRANV